MNRLLWTSRQAARCLLFALTLGSASCDLTDLKDAVDDFDLIIELPPINTVVNAQIVDVRTQDPIGVPVVLTFSGTNASRLIDAYSDPITTLTVRNGLVSFGIDNALRPTATSPVTFTVTVEAPGYEAESRTMALYHEGSSSFLIRLLPSDARVAVRGTVGTVATGTSAGAAGLTGDLTLTAPAPLPGAQIHPTLEIGQGTVFTTENGTPLTGALTTSVRFLSQEALALLPEMESLPESAPDDAQGTVLDAVVGALFTVTDAQGNVADSIRSLTTGGGGAVGPARSHVPPGTQVEVNVPLPDLLFERVRASLAGGSRLTVWRLSRPQRHRPGETAAQKRRRIREARPQPVRGCFATLDVPTRVVRLAGSECQGRLYVFLSPPPIAPCVLSAVLNITNSAAVPQTVSELRLTGGGLTVSGSPGAIVPAGGSVSRSVRDWLNTNGVVPTGGAYTVTATTESGSVAQLGSVNPCSGTWTLPLAAAAALVDFEVEAALACPADQEFDPEITSESLDAVSLSYRETGVEQPFTFIESDNFDLEATESSIFVTGNVSLKRSTSYTFRSVFGTDVTTRTATTPSSGNVFRIELNPSDIGFLCKLP